VDPDHSGSSGGSSHREGAGMSEERLQMAERSNRHVKFMEVTQSSLDLDLSIHGPWIQIHPPGIRILPVPLAAAATGKGQV
jgi:hypothetical protein